MRFNRLHLLILLALVICSASAKRISGGSKSSSRGSWGLFGKSKSSNTPAKHSSSNHAPTSFHNTGKTSSSDFLHHESGRPSVPRPAMPSAPVRSSNTGYHAPSAPPQHTFNTHSSPTHNTGIAHDRHQQSSATGLNSSPYGKQPATNPHFANEPYKPSGGYGSHAGGIPPAPHGVSVPSHSGSPPYPVHQPNHPHPNPSITSSSYPSSNSHPIGPSSYPSLNSHPPSYHPGGYGAPPSYHAPSYGSPSFHAPPPAYHAPPAYQPASAPFVPGKTVYVMQDSGRRSGPGIGSIIAGGVAGGVAAGATNAIVDHAISSIFRPSSNHVHTYPSAPAPGTPTSVTNNYYYGNSGPQDANNNNNNNNNGPPQSSGNGQPIFNNNGSPAPYNGQSFDPSQNTANVNPQNNPSAGGVQGNPGIGIDNRSNPSMTSNGAVSKTPDGQPENAPVNANIIPDEKIMMLTEELFEKQDKNLNQYVDLNLQSRNTNVGQDKVPDQASEPLFNLKSDLDSIPTVTALRALYDNYERNGTLKEAITSQRRDEEKAFLDEIMKTPVMRRALDWLADQKFVQSDEEEKKDMLKRMWFSVFDDTSSGFERIFLSEIFGDGGTVGMQNWLYFAHLESQKNVNYLGFVDTLNLSGKGFLIKLHYETAGFTIQNATIFAGTAPELELALYTICFHARPNNWCPVSLGGAKFFILTHSFRYFGKDIIDLAFPAF